MSIRRTVAEFIAGAIAAQRRLAGLAWALGRRDELAAAERRIAELNGMWRAPLGRVVGAER